VFGSEGDLATGLGIEYWWTPRLVEGFLPYPCGLYAEAIISFVLVQIKRVFVKVQIGRRTTFQKVPSTPGVLLARSGSKLHETRTRQGRQPFEETAASGARISSGPRASAVDSVAKSPVSPDLYPILFPLVVSNLPLSAFAPALLSVIFELLTGLRVPESPESDLTTCFFSTKQRTLSRGNSLFVWRAAVMLSSFQTPTDQVDPSYRPAGSNTGHRPFSQPES